MSFERGSDARVAEGNRGDGTREIAADVAYRRLFFVNVVFVGWPRAGDRQWVLVDAGLFGTRAFIKRSAEARFGANARPAAIVLTHGHWDHVGALEELAAEWDAPVYAHSSEQPYLSGGGRPTLRATPRWEEDLWLASLASSERHPSMSAQGCKRCRPMEQFHPCLGGDGFTHRAIRLGTSPSGGKKTKLSSLATLLQRQTPHPRMRHVFRREACTGHRAMPR